MTIYAIGYGRELDVTRAHGLVLLDVRAPDGSCTGALAIREPDLAAFCAALAREAGTELPGKGATVPLSEKVGPLGTLGPLRVEQEGQQGQGGQEISLERDGPLVHTGERGRPRLYIAPKPGYSHRNPHEASEVDAGPSQEPEAPCDARAGATGEAAVTSPGGTP